MTIAAAAQHDDARCRARSNRCAARATAPETRIPATPIAMYVTGSQADP